MFISNIKVRKSKNSEHRRDKTTRYIFSVHSSLKIMITLSPF